MTTVNINVLNDADFYRVFQYQTLSGVPIDITGTSMVMMLRRHAKDEAVLMVLSTATNEITITDGPQGLFSILIKQLDLEKLGLGEYAHSLVMTIGSGEEAVKRGIWNGKLTNNPGPSR